MPHNKIQLGTYALQAVSRRHVSMTLRRGALAQSVRYETIWQKETVITSGIEQ